MPDPELFEPGTPSPHPLAPNRKPGPLDPLELMRIAVEKGLDADQLDKLLTLQERWSKARAAEAFALAMNACQREMPLVVRDKKSGSGSYASLDAVNPVCKPIYTKHGFALCFAEEDSPLPTHKRTICDVRHSAGHCERYHIDLPLDGVGAKGNPIGQMNAVQAAISTGTYGQRALLCRIFNITIGDTDKDGAGKALTPQEVESVNELISDIREAGGEVKFEQLLAFALNVKAEDIGELTLDDMPRKRLPEVLRLLKAKLKKYQGGEA